MCGRKSADMTMEGRAAVVTPEGPHAAHSKPTQPGKNSDSIEAQPTSKSSPQISGKTGAHRPQDDAAPGSLQREEVDGEESVVVALDGKVANAAEIECVAPAGRERQRLGTRPLASLTTGLAQLYKRCVGLYCSSFHLTLIPPPHTHTHTSPLPPSLPPSLSIFLTSLFRLSVIPSLACAWLFL